MTKIVKNHYHRTNRKKRQAVAQLWQARGNLLNEFNKNCQNPNTTQHNGYSLLFFHILVILIIIYYFFSLTLTLIFNINFFGSWEERLLKSTWDHSEHPVFWTNNIYFNYVGLFTEIYFIHSFIQRTPLNFVPLYCLLLSKKECFDILGNLTGATKILVVTHCQTPSTILGPPCGHFGFSRHCRWWMSVPVTTELGFTVIVTFCEVSFFHPFNIWMKRLIPKSYKTYKSRKKYQFFQFILTFYTVLTLLLRCKSINWSK